MKYYKFLLYNLKNRFIGKLNILPFTNKYFSGMATIFMLHRVYPLEPTKLLPNENMKVSPEFLEKFIIELKSKGFEFISLDKLHEILQNGEKVKKQIVFTLDDGYKDNFKNAYPIFKKHKVPFTIYITTSMPEKELMLWWYILEDLLIEYDEIILSNDKYFNCKTEREKINTFLKIREIIISFKPDNFKNKLQELFKNYQIDWQSKCNELAMDWDEIISLSKDDLVTIASHTLNHYAFNRLSEKEIISEIVTAKNIIESKIKRTLDHFSYPFGSRHEIGQREFNIVRKMNFKTATTTRNGNIYSEHINHLECLPRIILREGFKVEYIGNIRRKKRRTI